VGGGSCISAASVLFLFQLRHAYAKAMRFAMVTN
jgi:hypothetical protein